MLTSDSNMKRPIPVDLDGGPDTIPVEREIPNPLAALEQPADVGRGVRAVLQWICASAGVATVVILLLKVLLSWHH